MAKTCIEPNCKNPVFSHSYCKKHQYKRTDTKPRRTKIVQKKAVKKKKKAISLPSLKKKVQLVFNEFIRLRDQGQPCISCGGYGVLQAGHYFNVKGYDGLRFDPDNTNGECPKCNLFDDSHLIGYGERLPMKIGEERYLALKARAANYKQNGYKWARAELLDLLALYTENVRSLKSENNS